MAQDKITTPHKKPSATNIAKRVSHLEGELQRTLERYELVWQATNDVLYDLHIESGQVTWSAALQRQFGYSKHETTSTLEWWVSHIHPDDALRVEEGFSDWFMSRQDTWRNEYRFRKANGLYSYVLDRGFLLRNPDGSPQRIIGTLLDITEQKQIERAKDEFISLVSHQLRTPLTVIRVYGDMFAEGLLGPLTTAQAEHIARMTDASVRLIKLVDDILNISRVEVSRYETRRQWTDVNHLITESMRDAQLQAIPKGITITYEPCAAAERVFTDSEILRQIIENLLTNAIRYTKPQQGKIAISCTDTEHDLVIAVRDNGIGIPRADQKRIFERFYRAHNAANIAEHGTGLGLYLVRILSQSLGGRVWFQSSRKTGTTFYVTIPRD